jgi:hypothetical protein
VTELAAARGGSDLDRARSRTRSSGRPPGEPSVLEHDHHHGDRREHERREQQGNGGHASSLPVDTDRETWCQPSPSSSSCLEIGPGFGP